MVRRVMVEPLSKGAYQAMSASRWTRPVRSMSLRLRYAFGWPSCTTRRRDVGARPRDRWATVDSSALKRRNWPSNDVHGNTFRLSLGRQGSRSEGVLSPEEVITRSQPHSMAMSDGAAHFELANHLWRSGHAALAIAHFNECHRLQPDNWTYKRQARSAMSNERDGGEFGRFGQAPAERDENSWPYSSDFWSDRAVLRDGEYYPATM